MTSRLGAAWAAWERFWFGPVDLVLVSLFRLVFGSGLFLFYLGRQWDYRFLFSEEGIAPYALARAALDEHARTVGWLASAGPLGPILHVLLLALLLGLAVGTLGRGFAWAALVLHLVFIQRNPFVAYGPDMVATCWLLYLSLTDCNRYLALRPRWMGGPRALGPAPELTRDPLSAIGMRMIQVHLCVIYGYSGLHKLAGRSWWRGDALWNALANGQYVDVDLTVLRHVPALVAVATSLVVLWEAYFPVLVWIGPLRPPVLALGVLLHALTGALMNLTFFAWFMIAAYVLFADPVRLRRWLIERSRPWPS